MDKIQRATEIHRSMTPHQMALRIVEMEDYSAAAIEAVNAAREAIAETSAKLTEYNAKLDSYDKQITELQDALELAEEAVRAKHSPDIAKMVVPKGWQLVPVEPTKEQWGGLARSIVFWMRSYPSDHHTPATLVDFITSLGHAVPKWMEEESELLAKSHVISKGTAATLIYKAMLAAAPKLGGE